MNDDEKGNTSASRLTPVIGFAIGALVGAGLTLLLAPASGERTRRRLGNVARRLTRDAQHSFDEARETVTGLGEDVKSAIDAGREAFQHDGKPRESRVVSRVAPMLDPPVPGGTR